MNVILSDKRNKRLSQDRNYIHSIHCRFPNTSLISKHTQYMLNEQQMYSQFVKLQTAT